MIFRFLQNSAPIRSSYMFYVHACCLTQRKKTISLEYCLTYYVLLVLYRMLFLPWKAFEYIFMQIKYDRRTDSCVPFNIHLCCVYLCAHTLSLFCIVFFSIWFSVIACMHAFSISLRRVRICALTNIF